MLEKKNTSLPAILNKDVIFSKTGNRKVKEVLSVVGSSGRGEDIRKTYRRVNMEEISTHV
jgi:hypothetical protein